jgi:hypothetical protein
MQDFSVLCRVQTDSEAHPIPCSMGIRSNFPGVNWEWHEAHLSLPSGAEANSGGTTFARPITFSWHTVWYSGQSYWLQIQRAGLDSRRYTIF